MARVNIAFTIPDDQMARVLAALRTHYGPVRTEVAPSVEGDKAQFTEREMTAAEILDALRDGVISHIRSVVGRVEAEAAKKAASDTLSGVTG